MFNKYSIIEFIKLILLAIVIIAIGIIFISAMINQYESARAECIKNKGMVIENTYGIFERCIYKGGN